MQTHFKPSETFQYTHFSSCYHLNCKKSFIKGEALRLLRTNSVRENFEKRRGYPLTLVQEILTEVKFADRKEALRNKTKKQTERFCCLLPPPTQSGHTESQNDFHETLPHHSTAT